MKHPKLESGWGTFTVLPGKKGQWQNAVDSLSTGKAQMIAETACELASETEKNMAKDMSFIEAVSDAYRGAFITNYDEELSFNARKNYLPAVELLGRFWKYGKALKLWHNAAIQIDRELVKAGDKAGPFVAETQLR